MNSPLQKVTLLETQLSQLKRWLHFFGGVPKESSMLCVKEITSLHTQVFHGHFLFSFFSFVEQPYVWAHAMCLPVRGTSLFNEYESFTHWLCVRSSLSISASAFSHVGRLKSFDHGETFKALLLSEKKWNSSAVAMYYSLLLASNAHENVPE